MTGNVSLCSILSIMLPENFANMSVDIGRDVATGGGDLGKTGGGSLPNLSWRTAHAFVPPIYFEN